VPRSLPTVSFGPEVVKALLPQRPPMLMVDRIRGLDLAASPPRLLASRYVSANEATVTGHFPQLGLVPGVITVEGLAQAAGLLGRLADAADRWTGDLLTDLQNLEHGATLHAGFDRQAGREFLDWLGSRELLHVVGATNIKLVRPIFPGCRLDHTVSLTRRLGLGYRFAVQSEVDGVLVAEGTLGASTVEAAWPP